MKKTLCLIFFFFLSTFALHAQQSGYKFHHILITNDDGIEGIDRLVALAKRVKPLADRVSIIVSQHDRSGSSNYTSLDGINISM